MEKYLNKGLLYAWFNSAKIAISIGMFVWGVISYKIIEGNLMGMKSEIAHNFNNYFYTTTLNEYVLLGVIFIAIYSIAKGINKRNTEMFLSSGPYTKKQIRFNELICLLVTLILFIVTYIYIAIMISISHKEFLSIVEGYQEIITIEILKITLFGIIGIVFMLIIDSMFSNSAVGFFCMISIIPVSIFIIIMKICSTISYIGVGNKRSLLNLIEGINPNDEYRKSMPNVLLNKTNMKDITINELSIEVIIALAVIVLMLILYSIVQRKYKLEKCNKIFSSKTNENIIVTLISIGIASFGDFFILSDYIRGMQGKNGHAPLVGTSLAKGLGAEIICIMVIGFIAYKIIKRVLRNVV
jgi:hypothetical protein